MAPTTIYEAEDMNISVPETSVFTFLFEEPNYYSYPESKIAYIEAKSGKSLTRGQTKDLSLRFAWGLRNIVKLKRGDTALIFSPNTLAYPVITFGCVAAGVKVTFANNFYTTRELAHQVKDSQADVIIAHPSVVKTAEQTWKSLGKDPTGRVLAAALERQEVAHLEAGCLKMPDLLAGPRLEQEEKFDGAESRETVYMCYSSGTTGLPKGVETMHSNVTTALTMTREALKESYLPDQEVVVVSVLPFFHIFGLVAAMQHNFLQGATLVFLQQFEPVPYLTAIQKYRGTNISVAPPLLVFLNTFPDLHKFDLSSLSVIGSGAAPLPVGLVHGVRDRFKKLYGTDILIGNGYGMTETSPCGFYLPRRDCMRKIGSVGKLFPGTRARLVDPATGEDVAKGEEGEVWFKGPHIMKGYLNNTEATKNAITEDGWLKTGDLAKQDLDGFWWIVGRSKELIKYKGFQVSPPELEDVISRHPAVADVGVIGVFHEQQATELPRAYVVPKHGMASVQDPEARKRLAESIQKYVEERVVKYKFLRGGVFFVEAIPKNPSGKILRKDMRAWLKPEATAKL